MNARKLQREKLKREYKKFCRTWNVERTYQQHLIVQGENPERVLGKKPTFEQYLKYVVNRKEQVKLVPKSVEQQISEEDLTWSDE